MKKFLTIGLMALFCSTSFGADTNGVKNIACKDRVHGGDTVYITLNKIVPHFPNVAYEGEIKDIVGTVTLVSASTNKVIKQYSEVRFSKDGRQYSYSLNARLKQAGDNFVGIISLSPARDKTKKVVYVGSADFDGPNMGYKSNALLCSAQ